MLFRSDADTGAPVYTATQQPAQQAPAEPAPAAPQRDYLNEAHQAQDAAMVRAIYRDATNDGARPEYLEQIAQVGKDKAAAEQGHDDENVPDAEIVEERAQLDPAIVNAFMEKVYAGWENVDSNRQTLIEARHKQLADAVVPGPDGQPASIGALLEGQIARLGGTERAAA